MTFIWQDANTWKFDPASGHKWHEGFKGKKFDSFLGESVHFTQNHVVRLILRIFLHPVQNQTVAYDTRKRDFPIKNWGGREWAEFKDKFWKQANKWNNKFWLIPPPNFNLKDVKNGSGKLRPNFKCALQVELVPSVLQAHRVINVYNLDIKGVKEEYDEHPTSGTFRSNSTNLDSLDINPRNSTYEDADGELHRIENRYTITHEVGHAIGLPHVGVLKSLPDCKLAIKKFKAGDKNVATHLSRGANSEVCYGEHSNLGFAENIMGLGMRFDDFNAKPWIKRAAMHTNTHKKDWSVRLSHIMPASVRG